MERNESNLKIKKNIFYRFLNGLFIYLKELFLLGTEGFNFDSYYNNTIKFSDLTRYTMASMMNKIPLEVFKPTDDIVLFKNKCDSCREIEEFNKFDKTANYKIKDIFKAYCDNSKFLDDFVFDKHLNEITENDLKEKYRVLSKEMTKLNFQ